MTPKDIEAMIERHKKTDFSQLDVAILLTHVRQLVAYIQKFDDVVEAVKLLKTSHRLDDLTPKNGESFYVLSVESHKRLVSAIEKLEEQ